MLPANEPCDLINPPAYLQPPKVQRHFTLHFVRTPFLLQTAHLKIQKNSTIANNPISTTVRTAHLKILKNATSANKSIPNKQHEETHWFAPKVQKHVPLYLLRTTRHE